MLGGAGLDGGPEVDSESYGIIQMVYCSNYKRHKSVRLLA